ncbi:MAG: hypothetical protein LBG06_05165 [Deltaproteobacteria bacterium]|jgi:RNA:NAD 2'-phosphotransferase (TPT1/KptA family)|nr:hypothetical protein [Deltaproteobacteria bacterium]
MAHSKISQDRLALEKLIRYVLDTAPHEYGLVPGDGGWVLVKELLAAVREEDGFRSTVESRVMELVNQPGGIAPFEAEGGLIRLKPALQNGPPPLPADLQLPRELWVAVKQAGWQFAAVNGLRPRRPKENRIPLFNDREMALKVARRFCPDPVAVKVFAAKARDKGVVFEPFAETLWLADEIPAGFLSGPPLKPLEEKETRKKAAPGESSASFPGLPLTDPLALHGKRKGRFSDSPDWKTQTRRDRRGGKGDR